MDLGVAPQTHVAISFRRHASSNILATCETVQRHRIWPQAVQHCFQQVKRYPESYLPGPPNVHKFTSIRQVARALPNLLRFFPTLSTTPPYPSPLHLSPFSTAHLVGNMLKTVVAGHNFLARAKCCDFKPGLKTCFKQWLQVRTFWPRPNVVTSNLVAEAPA